MKSSYLLFLIALLAIPASAAAERPKNKMTEDGLYGNVKSVTWKVYTTRRTGNGEHSEPILKSVIRTCYNTDRLLTDYLKMTEEGEIYSHVMTKYRDGLVERYDYYAPDYWNDDTDTLVLTMQQIYHFDDRRHISMEEFWKDGPTRIRRYSYPDPYRQQIDTYEILHYPDNVIHEELKNTTINVFDDRGRQTGRCVISDSMLINAWEIQYKGDIPKRSVEVTPWIDFNYVTEEICDKRGNPVERNIGAVYGVSVQELWDSYKNGTYSPHTDRIVRFKYTFDRRGNWTEATEYDFEGIRERTVREIVYY